MSTYTFFTNILVASTFIDICCSNQADPAHINYFTLVALAATGQRQRQSHSTAVAARLPQIPNVTFHCHWKADMVNYGNHETILKFFND